MTPRRSSLIAILLFLLLPVFACGPASRRVEPTDLFWPSPPDQPRIRYVESIYSEDDIGRVYSFSEKLFGKSYIDTMERPYGVFARGDKLYATDLIMKDAMVFDLAEKRMFRVGAREGLRSPASIAVDSQGGMYIADAATSKIVVFNADRTYKTSFPVEGRPVAVAVNDSLRRLYAVDRNSHQVRVLDLEGRELFTFGGLGRDDGKFNFPLSITVDRSGAVYVLDSGNFRVQIFTAQGKFLKKFGSVGDLPGQFANPKGIAVDSDGHIYVTDGAFSNFQIFDQEGNTLLFIGGLGPRAGQFHLPAAIAIDEHDRIFVADQLNKRIEVFQYLKAP